MTGAEKRAVRERASPEVWREGIERWKLSGLKAKEFAAAENLSARNRTANPTLALERV